MNFSNIQKYNLKDKLKKLDASDCYEVFEILKEDTCFKYSIKNDGILFDLNRLSNETLFRINEILKKNIDEIDNKLTYNSYFDEKYNNTLSYKLNKQLLKLKI